jgi:hypothetical protein
MSDETPDERQLRDALGDARRRMLRELQTKEDLNIDKVHLDPSDFEKVRGDRLEQDLGAYLALRVARETLSREFGQADRERRMTRAAMASAVVSVAALVLSILSFFR